MKEMEEQTDQINAEFMDYKNSN